MSNGESTYDGLILGLRRRLSHGFDFTGSYTLSRGAQHDRHRGDELDAQQHSGRDRPVRRSGQHRAEPPHRRASPRDGQRRRAGAVGHSGRADLHLSLGAADRYVRGRRHQRRRQGQRHPGAGLSVHGLNDDGTATFKDIGACENDQLRPRRAVLAAEPARVSKSFRLGGTARIEAIGEVFNLFNAKNPALPITSQRVSARGRRAGELHAAGRVRG